MRRSLILKAMEKNVLLFGVGCFNPPTIMHSRMFYVARDHLAGLKPDLVRKNVLGAIVSPVHDAYPKVDLIAAEHRVNMVRLANDDDDFVRVSTWESRNGEDWTRTRRVLDHHKEQIELFIQGLIPRPEWINETVSKADLEDVRILLLCGDDLIESFNTPGLWAPEDIERIVSAFGIVVLSRTGNKAQEQVHKSHVLYENRHNIYHVLNSMGADISSTKVRLAVRRGHSVKYMVNEKVIEYIRTNDLYALK